MNEQLCAQYSLEEIKCALFQMYPTKSPGPDGMPPFFFQHYWDTIGDEVTDRVVWHLEKSGVFSVKTAYMYSFHHSQVHQPFDLTVGVAFWKKIWKVNILNGAKETKSAIHLCRDCPFTRQVLQSNNILSQERNNRVWDGKNGTALDVVFSFMARLNDFRSVIIKPGMGRGRIVRASWKPPPHGIVKINVDGSFISGTHSGSTGFVIRDNSGSFLAYGGQAHKGVVSTEHVEVLACRQAIVFAIANNFQPAIIETNAQVVYLQLINHHHANLSVLG
ncbi:hypothetical protein ACLB2K_045616 [Fragaria x ananassa]